MWKAWLGSRSLRSKVFYIGKVSKNVCVVQDDMANRLKKDNLGYPVKMYGSYLLS